MPIFTNENNKDVKRIEKMKKMLKKFGRWYFGKYMRFYEPIIKCNINPFTI